MFTATTRVSGLLAALALSAPAAAQAGTPTYERVLGARAEAGVALYAHVETARARAELESALTKRGQRLNELVATNRSSGMWARLPAAFSLGWRAKVLDSVGEAGASVYPTVAFRDVDLGGGAVAVTAAVWAGEARALASDDLQAAKSASARFHSLAQARRAGYVRESPCIPGEGFHYGNPDLLRDPVLDPRRPELMLYELKPNGKLRLVGVEYFKADADQNLATTDDRPSLFGRPFVGPMPGHFPGQPAHYELHVFLWDPDPDGGIFAFPNDNVNCPPLP